MSIINDATIRCQWNNLNTIVIGTRLETLMIDHLQMIHVGQQHPEGNHNKNQAYENTSPEERGFSVMISDGYAAMLHIIRDDMGG